MKSVNRKAAAGVRAREQRRAHAVPREAKSARRYYAPLRASRYRQHGRAGRRGEASGENGETQLRRYLEWRTYMVRNIVIQMRAQRDTRRSGTRRNCIRGAINQAVLYRRLRGEVCYERAVTRRHADTESHRFGGRSRTARPRQHHATVPPNAQRFTVTSASVCHRCR